MSEDRTRVAVLFGGRSAEHEISVLSARSVIEALDPARYEVTAIGVTKEGRWVRMPSGPPALASGEAREALPRVTAEAGSEIALEQDPGSRSLVSPDGTRVRIDVVFPVMHGPYGEDGSIQGFLEMAGVPYVGAGVLGSALGMDKAMQKALLAAAGIPVVEHVAIYEREWADDPEAVEARAAHLGFPMFVKPAALGSSVGITKVVSGDELGPAVDAAFGYGRKVVLERAMEGAREIECAVLGNDDPVASVAGEIVPIGHAFYDYEAKYLDGSGSELRIPAELPAASLAEVQRLAVGAFRAIDAAGMARVDFFLPAEGPPVVNEINTIPGFTQISMYPKLWEASGVSYAELVDRLVQLAIERHELERKRGRGL